jgi:hypothetical protein
MKWHADDADGAIRVPFTANIPGMGQKMLRLRDLLCPIPGMLAHPTSSAPFAAPHLRVFALTCFQMAEWLRCIIEDAN